MYTPAMVHSRTARYGTTPIRLRSRRALVTAARLGYPSARGGRGDRDARLGCGGLLRGTALRWPGGSGPASGPRRFLVRISRTYRGVCRPHRDSVAREAGRRLRLACHRTAIAKVKTISFTDRGNR